MIKSLQDQIKERRIKLENWKENDIYKQSNIALGLAQLRTAEELSESAMKHYAEYKKLLKEARGYYNQGMHILKRKPKKDKL